MGNHAGQALLRATFALVMCGALGGTALAASNPNDFCVGDPCVISADKIVDAGATVDFGARTVVLQKQLTVANLPSGAVGSATLKAGSFQITAGGFVKASNSSGPAGTVTVEAINDIQLNGGTSLGDFRMSGQDAGNLTLKTTNGSVTGNGRLILNGDGTLYSGGSLTITSGGNISLTGNIEMTGGTQGGGGTVNLSSVGDTSITGFLSLSGGDVGGGFLDVTAGGNITFGVMNLSGSADAGDAGIVTMSAGGNVNFNGKITGNGADNFESCGDGADIDVTALGTITVGAVAILGRGLDCAGGFLALDADTVLLNGLLEMGGTGLEGEGGDLDVAARTLIRQSGTVKLDGGDGGAGDLLYISDTLVEVLGFVDASGRSTNSPGSSLIEIDGAQVFVSGGIDASGGTNAAGGDVTLSGCDINVTSTSVIDATGQLGLITIEGSDTITLRGTFLANVLGGNDIEVSAKSNPPDIAGATFSPPPNIVPNVLLVPCRVCDTNAQCNDNQPCTDDVCTPATGCTNTPRNSGPCEDGNLCTAGDTCAAGVCVSGPPNPCDDGNLCTLDACFPGLGCVSFPTSGSCDDGDACTTGDNCNTGSCVGAPVVCDDGNACTNNVCSGGACTYPPNSNPCNDGNSCTTNDTCSGGSCVGGPPPNCADTDVCTSDTCNPVSGCQHAPIPGCVDTDGDGTIDDQDECTLRAWTASPTTPPNQHPLKFRANVNKLAAADGDQQVLLKGLFNAFPGGPVINPAANGIHIYAEDGVGPLFDVSIPAGTGCGPDDGWTTVGSALNQSWKYRNKSGALPPGCAPGSARGIASVLIKDGRQSTKQALQFKLKAKDATLLRDPAQPLTRIQVSLALAAQPAPGTASVQAKAGQCAEALFTGNPIPSGNSKPSCKPKIKNGQLDGVNCKGL